MSKTKPSANAHRPSGIELEPSEDFVLTEAVTELTDRALAYLYSGYAVHLAGPAGTGKTTLAFHIAAQLGRPITLLHGNDEFATSDLVGRDSGYTRSSVVDNFIHSVLKTEERFDIAWSDNRLTTCCERGHTMIYDEFNRTPPEANNILLSVLEEGILDLPRTDGGDRYVGVHPEFRAIFTSNPEEYAGVHRTQDALLDRVITLHLSHYDAETEARITAAKSGADADEARTLVDLIRVLREVGPSPARPTVRSAIAIAKVCMSRGVRLHGGEPFFRAVCRDVLLGTLGPSSGERGVTREELDALIDTVWSDGPVRRPAWFGERGRGAEAA